ncbi:hypothetical protein OHJ28_13575 [Dickeya fangzhongdai]|uniref:Mor transcription activator family protein n=1 Tax=Dickeya fangzhongdai TaxID=1778540 RepID=UPI003307AE7D
MELERVAGLLPDVVLQIADLIGFPATARLIERFGGTTFPIGKGIHALGAARAELLRETIGAENATLLSKTFGGDIVYLPRCAAALRELRNQRFMHDLNKMTESGTSITMAMSRLCPEYGFSDRHAWDMIKSTRCSESQQHQQSLF